MATSVICDNIEKLTIENRAFRRVISTSDQMQLVLMSLHPNEDIGMEVHPKVTQFFRVERGSGVFEIDLLDGKGIQRSLVKDGWFMFVPAGAYHNLTSTGLTDLKLYTIYSPPNHPSDRLDITKPQD